MVEVYTFNLIGFQTKVTNSEIYQIVVNTLKRKLSGKETLEDN